MISNKYLFLLISRIIIFIFILSSCGGDNPDINNDRNDSAVSVTPETPIEIDNPKETVNIVDLLGVNPEEGNVYDLSVIKIIDSYDSVTGEYFKLICGECTPESEIVITGENITETAEYSGRSRFFIPVYLKNNIECEIVIATERGESVAVVLEPIENVTMSSFTAGKKNFIHWPDINSYLCNNYPDDRSLENIYNGLQSRYERIREATGKDTKFFILLAPDPLSLYDETASDKLKQMRRDAIETYVRRSRKEIDPEADIYTAMNQIADYINSKNPEFRVVDMTSVFKEIKKQETYPRLYHTTDNHWSALGAYLGYCEIMNYVYETSGIEKTKPFGLSDFDIVDYRLSYNVQFGLQDPASENIYEVVDSLVYKNRRIARMTSGQILNDGKFWSDVREKMSFTTDNKELPTAVFLRDSFATALYPMLNEHFNFTYYSDTWDYSLDYNWLSEVKPDYVFIIAVERLSMSALSQR